MPNPGGEIPTLGEVTELRSILPICMYCKSIRDDANYGHSVESYISQQTQTEFSHSICPACHVKVREAWLGEPPAE